MSGQIIGPIGVLPTASGFSPASLSGLIGWYDAQFSGGVLNTGTGIQATNSQAANTFVDRSGVGNDLTEPTQPPTFFTAGLTGGKPSVTFSTAGSTHLQRSSYAIGTGNTLSVFVVCQLTSGAAGFSRLLNYAKPGAGATFDNVGSASMLIRDSSNNAVNQFSNSVTSTAIAISLATTVRLGMIYDGSFVTPYLNGVAGTPLSQTNTPWVSAGILSLGADAVAFAAPWDGPVGEVIISTANLTSQVTAIETYFAGRW